MTNFFHMIYSDQAHEDLVADLLCGDTDEEYDADFIALLSQENGFQNMMIEIYPRSDGKPWTFRLDELEKGLAAAKQHLWELRKNDVKDNGQEH